MTPEQRRVIQAAREAAREWGIRDVFLLQPEKVALIELRAALDALDRAEAASMFDAIDALNGRIPAPDVCPWESFVEIFPMAERKIWARFCGYDAIYRWLHPKENRWVEEPEQIGMPMFASWQEAKEAVKKSPEPPTWKEYLASTSPPAPDVCECKTWGTDDAMADLLGNGHHHNCKDFVPTVGAVEIIRQLVAGIDYWASQEDGVPDELWAAYRNACFVVKGKFPAERRA